MTFLFKLLQQNEILITSLKSMGELKPRKGVSCVYVSLSVRSNGRVCICVCVRAWMEREGRLKDVILHILHSRLETGLRDFKRTRRRSGSFGLQPAGSGCLPPRVDLAPKGWPEWRGPRSQTSVHQALLRLGPLFWWAQKDSPRPSTRTGTPQNRASAFHLRH